MADTEPAHRRLSRGRVAFNVQSAAALLDRVARSKKQPTSRAAPRHTGCLRHPRSGRRLRPTTRIRRREVHFTIQREALLPEAAAGCPGVDEWGVWRQGARETARCRRRNSRRLWPLCRLFMVSRCDNSFAICSSWRTDGRSSLAV